MNLALTIFFSLSFTVFAVGLLTLAYYPLSLIFALRKPSRPVFKSGPDPLVSVIVPGYNEAKVVGNCVESILASEYPNFEIILVDDGSTDETLAVMKTFEADQRVRVIGKPNGGKASALNVGIAAAHGEILFFVDADGLFTPSAIREMLNGFTSEKVGAVCGNDAPVNLDRIQTQLACIQTHVGTGFVRRALALINCLPIVSGNIGAFRRNVIEKTGTFLEVFIGEDLELTWRVHKAGFQVNFAPRAVVLAEVPSTIKGLWKQRVRWARGLLQTVRIHRNMMFNLRYGFFGIYLPVNVASMVIIPLMQLVILILLPVLAFAGKSPVPLSVVGLIGWLGLLMSLAATIFAIALNHAWKDLRYIYAVLFWVPYSLMMNVVTLWALILEIRGARSDWNKLDRTGVITRRSLD
jgi:cellulose synthase/poly-beta-1,6-N-acetylglucosamine synthase-like glycosyltransferase